MISRRDTRGQFLIVFMLGIWLFRMQTVAAEETAAPAFEARLGESPAPQEKRALQEFQYLSGQYPDALKLLQEQAPHGVLIGTSGSSGIIAGHERELALKDIRNDGFVIGRVESLPGQLILSANVAHATIYAVHDLFDSLRLRKPMEKRTSPAFDKRWIYNWQSMSGPYIHPPFDRTTTVFDFSNLKKDFPSDELMRYFRRLAQMHINGMVLVNQLHDGPVLNYLDHKPEMNRLIGLAKEYGLEIFLYGWLDPHEHLDACPYNPTFREFWTSTTAQLKDAFPEIDGLLLNRFRNARNLYARNCEHCPGKTPDDRLKEAEKIICDILAERNMSLIEDLCTDDYTRLDREVGLVADPDLPVPVNAIRNNRGAYMECGDPPCPPHPLLYFLEPGRENTRHVMFNEQIFPEMRGKEFVPSAMGRRWEKFIRFYKEKGVDRIMGIAETHSPQWDLASADWYTFGRMIWNPGDPYKDIYHDWATLEFSGEVADEIVRILDLSLDVSTHMFFTGGVREAPLSMLLPLESTDVVVSGGVCGTPKAPDGHIGLKSPLDMYPPAVAREIHDDPQSRLMFDQYELTEDLRNQLLAEKRDCREKMDEILKIWKGMEGKIDPVAWRSQLKRLELSGIDARIWSVHLELYLDFKRCTLTKERVDEIEKEYGDLVGSPLTGGTYELLPEHYLVHTRDPQLPYPGTITLKKFIQQVRDLGYRMDTPAARRLRAEYEWGRWPE